MDLGKLLHASEDRPFKPRLLQLLENATRSAGYSNASNDALLQSAGNTSTGYSTIDEIVAGFKVAHLTRAYSLLSSSHPFHRSM